MKKVPDVALPKRGRPPKKQLATPESTQPSDGGLTELAQTGAKMSHVPDSHTHDSLRTEKQNVNNNQKKRNGSRSVSVGKTNITSKKKCKRLSDPAASGKRSLPGSRVLSKTPTGRKSLQARNETSLSKTTKQRAPKVAQGLESSSMRISGRGRSQGGLESSQEKKPRTKKLDTKKSARRKSSKELNNELQETHVPEIKRLSTTDGFWSSKASSRSNSPFGQPLELQSQKQTVSVKKDSRTATPEISPSSAKRQPLAKTRAENDESATPKSNIPVPELRRLRTTEGFSFSDMSVASRTGSRDVSPSSSSSIDRGTRQNARLISRGSENKNSAKIDDIDQVVILGDSVAGKAKIKRKKELDDKCDNLLEHPVEMSGLVAVNLPATDSNQQTDFETPISRFKKRKHRFTSQPKKIIKREQLSSHTRNRKALTLSQGLNKSRRVKSAPVLPQAVTEEPKTPILSTSTIISEEKKNIRFTRNSAEGITKKSPQKKTGPKQKKSKLPIISSLASQKISGDFCLEDMNFSTASQEIMLATDGASSAKLSISPEFVISDLLGSAELKRLNTTLGFWASTPDVGTVLGINQSRRLRDVDSNSTQGNSNDLEPKQARQGKPQSTLLQHRKKKLHALQNSLRKIKHHVNTDDSSVPLHPLNDDLSEKLMEAVVQTKAKPKKYPFGVKKRRYRKRSKLDKVGETELLEGKQTFEESAGSGGSKIDTKKPIESLDVKGGTKESESLKSGIDIKEAAEVCDQEMETSDSNKVSPSQQRVIKSWKRGRRRKASAILSSIKTRGRGNAERILNKSLEVLQNLEPNREDELFSVSLVTSKVRSDRRKQKKVKKDLHAESSLDVHVLDSETDKCQDAEVHQATNSDGKDNKKDEECYTQMISNEINNGSTEKNSVFWKKDSENKKDNIFETLGCDLFMQSGMSKMPCHELSSDKIKESNLLSESLVGSHVKFDFKPPGASYDQDVHDECHSETKASAFSLPDSLKKIITSEKSHPGKDNIYVKVDYTELKVDDKEIKVDDKELKEDDKELKEDNCSRALMDDISKQTGTSTLNLNHPSADSSLPTECLQTSLSESVGKSSSEICGEFGKSSVTSIADRTASKGEKDVESLHADSSVIKDAVDSVYPVTEKGTVIELCMPDANNMELMSDTEIVNQNRDVSKAKELIYKSDDITMEKEQMYESGDLFKEKEPICESGDLSREVGQISQSGDMTKENKHICKSEVPKEKKHIYESGDNNFCQTSVEIGQKQIKDDAECDSRTENNSHTDTMKISMFSSSTEDFTLLGKFQSSDISKTEEGKPDISTMVKDLTSSAHVMLKTGFKDITGEISKISSEVISGETTKHISVVNANDNSEIKELGNCRTDFATGGVPVIAHTDKVSILDTIHQSADSIRCKPQKKRKKSTTTFFKQKLHRKTTLSADPSISSVCTLVSEEEAAGNSVNEELNADINPITLPAKRVKKLQRKTISADPSISSVCTPVGKEEAAGNSVNEELTADVNPITLPAKRVRKRRRNAWQRGVLRKAAHLSRKGPIQKWKVHATASGMCNISTAGMLSSVNSLVSVGVATVSSDMTIMSNDVAAVTSGVVTVSSAVMTVSSDMSTITNDVAAVTIGETTVSSDMTTVSNDVAAVASGVTTVSNDITTVSNDVASGETTVSSDMMTVSSDVTSSSGAATLSSDVATVASGAATVSSGAATLPSDLATVANDMVTVASDVVTVSSGENSGNLTLETYSPAIKKSLKNVLKKLQTNANLANAVLDESYEGRSLRKPQPTLLKERKKRIRRKSLGADPNIQVFPETYNTSSSYKTDELHVEIPGDSQPIKRKRGRPKKHSIEALPKLTPSRMLPVLRHTTPCNKMPPNLSPQTSTMRSPLFFDTDESSKSMLDTEFVSESVDDTDLHLYLSGVSDEEQSPKKDSLNVSEAVVFADIPVYPEANEDISTSIMKDISLHVPELFSPVKSTVISGKEPKRPGRPKIKGRRGCPPGIPMTEEEKKKKAQQVVLSQQLYSDHDLHEFTRPAQTSLQTFDVGASSVFSDTASASAAKFSLRKKSTRSPLEMLALKRKQEEARYDLEQEQRQARLIHLREKRSARESGDGFSDEGDGGHSPENLMLCSVVLSDFVKNLHLDDIEASSGEEVSHQTLENMSASGESPKGNTFEDSDDEDWCADFQEHEDEEWNDSRPYIPRLKLKRVIKKGTQSQIKRTKVNTQSPKKRQHEPIKLVIKTEPNEQAGAKSGMYADLSKVDRSGFENSYVDFLKGKNESLSEKAGFPKQTCNTSRRTQPEVNTQNIVPDLSTVEILSLPTSGLRDSLLKADKNSHSGVGTVAPVAEHLSLNSPVTLSSTDVNVSVASADKLTCLEHQETGKRLSLVDDEEDDILILDLDEGNIDHNSEEGLNISSVSNVSQKNKITDQEQPVGEDICNDNGIQIRTQRTHSNDEMGLMLESYNSLKGDTLNNIGTEKNAAVNLASTENFQTFPENMKITQAGDVSHPMLKESTCGQNSMQQHSINKSQQSHIVSADGPHIGSEAHKKNTSEVRDAGQDSVDIINEEAFNVGEHKDGGTLDLSGQQDEGEMIPKVNKVTEKMIEDNISILSGEATLKETNNLPESELITVSDKPVGEYTLDATSDNNNGIVAFKSPGKVSAPVKKQGVVSDNNKSPKHSMYHSSEPEDWKIKVILHSDKFPSGKYSCKRCGFTTPAKVTIESHIYSHIPGVQFRCAYCESEFSSMAATSSHLKNTHSLSEAKLHISRHVDEKNFYDIESTVFSEENGQQSPVQAASNNANTGGQSPPVIISVVVSGGVASSRGGRSSSSARRFVCTHCGFSTNVKEDAEHHVLDLHSSHPLFACLLCSENVCYTESEIKDHCSIIHPARHHPYRKLPDFYDAEQLSLKEKVASPDDRENIFERMTSMFQDETQTSTGAVDHRQKAKEYLYLQEGWREKTRVEADSTTAVDYTEEHGGPSAPQTPSQEESFDESSHQDDGAEIEVTNPHKLDSKIAVSASNADLSETVPLKCDNSVITSSAVNISSLEAQLIDSDVPASVQDQEGMMSSHLYEPACPQDAAAEDPGQEMCHLPPGLVEENDDDGEGMGLKIVQVVSLSGQSEDMEDEQISSDPVRPDLVDDCVSHESCDNQQAATISSENTTSISENAVEMSVTSEHSSSMEESLVQREIQLQSTVEEQKTASEATAANDSTTPDVSAANTPSSITSPSFAGGLPLSYKCNACKVHTPYLLMMVKHLKAKHPNMRCFSCPYCKTTHSFVSQKQLRHHVKQTHPDKFGRNEIALSEDAKKFVEAMVLPMGPECIRVGNRIVLEEDIHTCTYCQVKMISLANVYEHLNTKHSDLFEFVCPLCQNFKSKMLTEISDHCLKTHMSSLDTDKVHVSVPKNLFTALTCISKNGKYIEKNLLSSAETEKASTSSIAVQRKLPEVSGATAEYETSAAKQSPLRIASVVSTSTVTQAALPIFAIPVVSAGIGAVATTRPMFAFSSSLFDTSSLTASPQMAGASQSVPLIQTAAASSFLSPVTQPAHTNIQHQFSKQSHLKPNERVHGTMKNLPVLNVPTIKPRTSSQVTKSLAGGKSSLEMMPQNALCTSSIASLLTTSATSKQHVGSTSSSPCLDNLPEDEPNPDAFKIFNLRPAGPLISPSSASPTISPGVPSVYPPVSIPMASGYIQGPIAGFPPNMVISPNLIPITFPFSQHQPLVQGMLARQQNPRSSPLSRHPHLSHPSSAASTSLQSSSPVRNSISPQEVATNVYLKKQQQQRELYLLKKQHHLETQRQQLLRQNQQQAVHRAYPAHQQPPSISGQVYQPQPLPMSSLPFDHQQLLPGPSDFSQSNLFPTGAPASSSSQVTSPLSSSPVRPTKGVHKRSSSLYQCPYCPVQVTLKALEVASHIHQNHPGKQVTFKKIV